MQKSRDPESLGSILSRYVSTWAHLPKELRYLNEEDICIDCHLVVRTEHAKKVVAAKGLQYFDPELEREVIKVAVRWCRCIEDERERVLGKASAFAIGLREANLPKIVPTEYPRIFTEPRLENFDEREGVEDAYALAGAFSLGDTPPILILNGESRTGKTHLAAAVGYALIDQGLSVRYELAPMLMAMLRPDAPSRSGDIIERCVNVNLLILDDLGKEKSSEWVKEQLFIIIDERWRNAKLTIVTTNLSMAAMEQNLGKAAVHRLYDNQKSQQCLMTCPPF